LTKKARAFHFKQEVLIIFPSKYHFIIFSRALPLALFILKVFTHSRYPSVGIDTTGFTNKLYLPGHLKIATLCFYKMLETSNRPFCFPDAMIIPFPIAMAGLAFALWISSDPLNMVLLF
jgi:hypothetical protein